MKDKTHGNIIILVILFTGIISTMLLIVSHTINLSTTNTASSQDYNKALHYARLALIQAKKDIYNLQCPNDNCHNGFAYSTTNSCHNQYPQNIAQQRACTLQENYHIITEARNCNHNSQWKGVCANFNNDNILIPTELPPYLQTSIEAYKPCSSYDQDVDNYGKPLIPIIDDKNSNYSRTFNTNDTNLCAQPRYQIEFIDLDYQGDINGQDCSNTNDTKCNSFLAQAQTINRGIKLLTDDGINKSAILYRVTVRSFGIDGNVRVTLIKYILINSNPSDKFAYQRVVDIT